MRYYIHVLSSMSGDENFKGFLHKRCTILICDSNGMNAMVIKTEILIDLQQLALRMFSISQGLTLPYDVVGA